MYYENRELLLKVDLSLAFKGTPILKGVQFEIYDTVEPGGSIPRGQVVAVLGPSGVGKTQLFRCIAGLQIPTEGAVWVNSDPEPVKEGEVGVVAQDYPLIETRTVMGNLTRAFHVAKKSGIVDFTGDNGAEKIATDYLKRFGLIGLTKHYPCQLSGGQRQRVAIIQQMMSSKHFLLMDEPFSGLDIIAKDSACSLIAEVAAADELNTIIITTHDIRTALASADRVILLGRDRDELGQIIPGARVMADLDLKVNDLCWIPGITRTEKFLAFVAEVERMFHDL
jgi:NitT/TauT family transport system ATP-binding protein